MVRINQGELGHGLPLLVVPSTVPIPLDNMFPVGNKTTSFRQGILFTNQ